MCKLNIKLDNSLPSKKRCVELALATELNNTKRVYSKLKSYFNELYDLYSNNACCSITTGNLLDFSADTSIIARIVLYYDIDTNKLKLLAYDHNNIEFDIVLSKYEDTYGRFYKFTNDIVTLEEHYNILLDICNLLETDTVKNEIKESILASYRFCEKYIKGGK